MRTRLAIVILGVGLLSAAVPLVAHHSFAAEYDAQKAVKFTGTVTTMEWINPHAWIHIDVKKPDGKVESWMIEAGAPNALLRRGFTKASLPVGTVITVEGYQAKDGANRANGRDITYQDGKKLFVGSSGTGAPDERQEK
ncbi:MAG: DUF6152 family protein [Acidobacteriota bacterium]